MADLFEDIYNFLQAPANERAAREKYKADIYSTAPSFKDLEKMKVDNRLVPDGANRGLTLSDTPKSYIGMKLGDVMYGPPYEPPADVANYMDTDEYAAKQRAIDTAYNSTANIQRGLAAANKFKSIWNSMVIPQLPGQVEGGYMPRLNNPAIDPWEGMRAPGEARVVVPGVSLGSVTMGSPAVQSVRRAPSSAELKSRFNPESEKAYNSGSKSYSSSSGMLMPTTSISGAKRYTYGD